MGLIKSSDYWEAWERWRHFRTAPRVKVLQWEQIKAILPLQTDSSGSQSNQDTPRPCLHSPWWWFLEQACAAGKMENPATIMFYYKKLVSLVNSRELEVLVSSCDMFWLDKQSRHNHWCYTVSERVILNSGCLGTSATGPSRWNMFKIILGIQLWRW